MKSNTSKNYHKIKLMDNDNNNDDDNDDDGSDDGDNDRDYLWW